MVAKNEYLILVGFLQTWKFFKWKLIVAIEEHISVYNPPIVTEWRPDLDLCITVNVMNEIRMYKLWENSIEPLLPWLWLIYNFSWLLLPSYLVLFFSSLWKLWIDFFSDIVNEMYLTEWHQRYEIIKTEMVINWIKN